jgi:hypothetical protein
MARWARSTLMRSLLHALLLLLVFLLAGCAPAPAPASAWVLWVFTSKVGAEAKDVAWLPTGSGGYETRAGCAIVADFGNAENGIVRFLCLPDTVDPPGPKGK